MVELQKMLNDYKPNFDLFTDDDETMTALKSAIDSLSQADRIIFVLYAETGSLREVGKMLGVSHTSIYKTINGIKRQIKDWCLTHYPNNNELKKMFDVLC